MFYRCFIVENVGDTFAKKISCSLSIYNCKISAPFLFEFLCLIHLLCTLTGSLLSQKTVLQHLLKWFTFDFSPSVHQCHNKKHVISSYGSYISQFKLYFLSEKFNRTIFIYTFCRQSCDPTFKFFPDFIFITI